MDDENRAIAALGYRCSVQLEGAASLWRLCAPDGQVISGASPSDRSARRDAAFTAFAVSAMARIRARRR